jgi:hypothetical protein
MSAHPPWQGRPAAPDRTPEGRQIVHTRFGAFVMREDGHWTAYYTAEQEAARLLRSPARPFRDRTDWNPLDDS